MDYTLQIDFLGMRGPGCIIRNQYDGANNVLFSLCSFTGEEAKYREL